MSTKEHEKSGSKPRRRSRKADQRGQKAEQQKAKPGRRDDAEISAMVASADTPASDAALPAELPSIEASVPSQVVTSQVPPSVGEVVSTDAPAIRAVAPADSRPISMRTIANAYGTYTERSFQETTSFVEKLIGVRSFGKAIEIQTEFAGQAYVTFVAETQKICGLYAELAKQMFGSWQGFTTKATPAGR